MPKSKLYNKKVVSKQEGKKNYIYSLSVDQSFDNTTLKASPLYTANYDQKFKVYYNLKDHIEDLGGAPSQQDLPEISLEFFTLPEVKKDNENKTFSLHFKNKLQAQLLQEELSQFEFNVDLSCNDDSSVKIIATNGECLTNHNLVANLIEENDDFILEVSNSSGSSIDKVKFYSKVKEDDFIIEIKRQKALSNVEVIIY